MKHFKTISLVFIGLISATFAFNIMYLVRLYQSIQDNVERDVMTALADADIDEMIIRMDSDSGNYSSRMREAIENNDSVFIKANTGTMEADLDPRSGEVINRTISQCGDTTVMMPPVSHDISHSNQLVQNISSSMHIRVDNIYNFNSVIMDSVLTMRLSEKQIYPDFVAVEILDSIGHIIQRNERIVDRDAFDVYRYCYNPLTGYSYQVYITPLTRHIFKQMRGVIITILLLTLLFSAAFIYLYQTITKLRTVEEMKDDFVSNMTHELKTPIAIAYSANDALLNYDTANDPQKKVTYLNIANKQLKRLSELVENILAMSMERRKTMKLKPEIINLRTFTEEISTAQQMRSDKEITIHVDVDEGVSIEADKTHLANILNNLIDNAIKYSGDSVAITITGNEKKISVADNGIGIPTKSIPYLFNKFYRVPHGNRQDVRGYGIGLYYVKSILDKMGWSIDVKSKKGEGSVFTIKCGNDGQ